MVVLEKPLSKVYPEIDVVTTPTGTPVAMVHCNNCTNEINAWAQLFKGFLEAMGQKPNMGAIFNGMFNAAQEGAVDGGGLMLYNYLSGEPITGMEEGRPLLARTPNAAFTFPDLMRVQLYSALASLRVGLDILAKEQVSVNRLLGHGGFFKTPVVGQRMMAAVTGTSVSVMDTAGEGGPWGMALLAAYLMREQRTESLEDFLSNRVFTGQQVSTLEPDPIDQAGFARFLQRYMQALPIEKAAVEWLREEE